MIAVAAVETIADRGPDAYPVGPGSVGLPSASLTCRRRCGGGGRFLDQCPGQFFPRSLHISPNWNAERL